MLVGLRLRHDRGFGVSVEGASFSGACALREIWRRGSSQLRIGCATPDFFDFYLEHMF